MDGSPLNGVILLESPPAMLPVLAEFRRRQYAPIGGLFKWDSYDWSELEKNPKAFARAYKWLPIRLTQGFFFIISPKDHPRLSLRSWCVNIQRQKETKETLRIYAVSRKKGLLEYAHRVVRRAGRSVIIDHTNGLTLDCRRENLRVGYQDLNIANTYHRERTKHPGLPRGVRVLSDGFFGGQIKINGKSHYSKRRWRTPEPAHRWWKNRHAARFAHNSASGEIRAEPPKFPPRIIYSDEEVFSLSIPGLAAPNISSVSEECPF